MEDNKRKISRREIIKGLATVPVAGALIYGWYRKEKHDLLYKEAVREEVRLDAMNPVLGRNVSTDKKIRLGIIGTGGRGRSLLKAAGFLNPEIIDTYIEDARKNKADKRYEEFLEAYGQANIDQANETVLELYNKIRRIKGNYLLRKIEVK